MKIAFLGNFRVDFTSESHYLKTFAKLGHEVKTYQESEYMFSQMDLEYLLSCDMFFWVHTHGWSNPGLEFVLERIKGKVPIVGYHLDLWLGISREQDLHNDSYWKWMDYFFSVDKLMVDWLNERHEKAMSHPKAFFLPAGVLEEECYLGTPREEYKCDVLFTGSGVYHQEWPYRGQLIQWLKDTYGDRFKHFGSGGNPVVRGKDLNDLYASAKVVIGDTLCKGFDYPYYLSDRVFETTGRGGMVIHPYIKGLEELFFFIPSQGVHSSSNEIATYTYGDFEGLKTQIDYLLADPEMREEIRINGYERTKRDHTYTQRLTKLIETIQNEKAR